MASGTVIIHFAAPSDNWCPSNSQDLVNQMYHSVTAYVSNSNEAVRIEFGNFLPGFCPETCEEFIAELNKVSRGYVVSTGQSVRVEFALPDYCCWNDPAPFIESLERAVSAYVI